MTVKDTLRECLIWYPSIFKNKWDVYHHLFMVIGNGYDWENGELVSGKRKSTVADAIKKHISFRSGDEDLAQYHLEALKEDILSILNWKERAKEFVPYDTEGLYPMCEYSRIMSIPDDITDDWREATTEMYEWLITNYNNLSSNNRKWVDKLKGKF